MKPILVLAALLCSVLPTFAQSGKVYTNADLTSQPVTWTRTVTAEELAGLKARQFVPPPATPGPTAFVLGSSERLGPMPPPYYVSTSAIADDLWRDPVLAYHLQHPLEAAYGLSVQLSGGPHGHAWPRVSAPAPARTITTGTPPATGRRVR
jgi:hypothetical protein